MMLLPHIRSVYIASGKGSVHNYHNSIRTVLKSKYPDSTEKLLNYSSICAHVTSFKNLYGN